MSSIHNLRVYRRHLRPRPPRRHAARAIPTPTASMHTTGEAAFAVVSMVGMLAMWLWGAW